MKPIGIFYEHPGWFEPMFEELERRGVPFERLLAHNHHFDPDQRQNPYSLVLNRMSPSAFTRGHGHAIPYTLDYLAYLDAIDTRVIGGLKAYRFEFSKANQLGLLAELGLPYPRSRVINHVRQAPERRPRPDLPAGHQTQHRRLRRRYPQVRHPRRTRDGRTAREARPGRRPHRPGAGVPPAPGGQHRARRGSGRRIPLRHPAQTRVARELQPVPGGLLQARRPQPPREGRHPATGGRRGRAAPHPRRPASRWAASNI